MNNKDKYKPKNSANQRQSDISARSKAGKKWWWVILLFIVVAVTVTVLVAATRKADPAFATSSTFTVRRDDLTVTVTEGGSIRAHNSIQYKCQVERRGVGAVSIVSIVPAGTYVTQEDVNNGMVLVELDSSALKERLEQEKMELAGDRENATSAEEAYHIQVKQNESDIAEARLNVRFALLDLQKYLGADLAVRLIKDVNEASSLTEYVAPFIEEVRKDPNVLEGAAAWQELKRLQDDIVLAEGNLKTAEDTLAGTIKLHDANYVSDLELERDKLTKKNREFSLQSTKISLNLFLDYDFPKNTERYISDYIEAGRQLDRTYAQCRSRLAQAQAKLSNAQERFRSQQTRVSELEKQIEYCTIKARAPGLVIYGTGGEEDRFRAMRGGSAGIIAEGESVYEGQAIVSMPDTASMVAEIGVHETEVDKVRLGQPATIVMDAFPDRVLQGGVLEVAPLPDQQRGWLNPDLKVYETLVSIDGTYEFLRSRMSCKVTVLIRQLEDVIIVPIQVVSNRGGRKVCYVMTSNGPQERVVQTGVFNDTFVQIIEGLEVSEEVMLNPPLFSEVSGAVGLQQQQPLPQRKAQTGQADTETETRPDGKAAERAEQFADSTDTPGERPRQGRESPMVAGPPQGMSFQPTDEMIDRMLAGLKKINPEKVQELEQLRKSDPEKFKTELMEFMKSMRGSMMKQGRNRMGQGSGDAEGGQNR